MIRAYWSGVAVVFVIFAAPSAVFGVDVQTIVQRALSRSGVTHQQVRTDYRSTTVNTTKINNYNVSNNVGSNVAIGGSINVNNTTITRINRHISTTIANGGGNQAVNSRGVSQVIRSSRTVNKSIKVPGWKKAKKQRRWKNKREEKWAEGPGR